MPAQIQFSDGPRTQVLPLGAGPLVVGGRGSSVTVPGATVTCRHARFSEEDGGYWVEALGGEGVRVNGVPVQRVQLRNRDRIQIGSLEVEFFEW